MTSRITGAITWPSGQGVAVTVILSRAVLNGYVVLSQKIQPALLRVWCLHKIRWDSVICSHNDFSSQQMLTVLFKSIRGSPRVMQYGRSASVGRFSSVLRPRQHSIAYMENGFTGQKTQPTVRKIWKGKQPREHKENTNYTYAYTQNSRQIQHISITQQVP